MANAARNQIQQAYNLIEQDRLEEAVTILQGVLSVQPNNESAWWMMANALTDPADAADALQNVLRINPNHAEAQEGLKQLLAEYPELSTMSPMGGVVGDFDFNFDEETPAFDTPARPTPAATSAAGAAGAGNFNFDIDSLLASTPATGTPTPSAANAPDWLSASSDSGSGDLDLDSLFGGESAFGLPSTSSEDADLSAMFDATLEDAPRPKPAASQPRPPATAPNMDDLFGSMDFGETPAPASATAPAAQMPADDFFSGLDFGETQQAATGSSAADDDLFGGLDFGQSTTAAPRPSATGDTTLNLTQAGINDLFGAPPPTRAAARPPDTAPALPTQNMGLGNLDDLFGAAGNDPEPQFEPTTPAQPDMDFEMGAGGALGNLDDLLGQYDSPPISEDQYAALPNMEGAAPADQDIDAFFQSPAGATPGFVDQIEEGQQPKKERGRRRREKGAAAAAAAGFPVGPSAETMAEIAVEQPATRPVRRERPAKPAPEPEIYDPYKIEARVNRRSPVRALVLFLVIAVVLLGLVVAALRLTAPSEVAQAAINVRNQLSTSGFEGANASVTDKNMGVIFCSPAVRREVEQRVFQAMDVIAANAAPVREKLDTANLRVVSCANPDRVLYAASTTLTDVIRYTEGGDRRAYRQSWR